ncbi:cytochrome-c peroxidase [Neomegalonema perideroedes]|uniref:cytochrome-c peroxidase n=1 Tax=Neomegalonema perideroedes TaxID=217219 RepID=UPI00036ABE99|nr:cytochrome c peroxidase [Neomegalonema perideroedes]
MDGGEAEPLITRLAGFWRLWLAAGACAVLAVGVAEALRFDPTNPAHLRRAYSGPSEDWPAPWIDEGVAFVELAAPDLPPAPEAGSPEALRGALGARLFAEPALSGSGHFSCESCHNRRLGWGDGLPRSFGHGRTEGRRNAPALFVSSRRARLFWDGRAESLEAQALEPLTAPHEMANADLSEIPRRLAAAPDYPALFAAAYGGSEIALEQTLDALAEFQARLDRPTRFDRFLLGRSEALEDEEILGLHLFRTKARCANCHFGADLTDGRFHNLGLSFIGRGLEDLGRYGATGDPEDAGKFLTPSLRHAAQTGPYMHNGLMPHLRGVVNFYDGGGGASHARSLPEERADLLGPASTSSPHLRPLDLTEDERKALVRFLEAL